MLTVAAMTELTAIVFTILVKEKLCSSERIREVLIHFRSGAAPNDQDNREMKFGKESLSLALDLLMKRLDETKQGSVLASMSSKDPLQ